MHWRYVLDLLATLETRGKSYKTTGTSTWVQKFTHQQTRQNLSNNMGILENVTVSVK